MLVTSGPNMTKPSAEQRTVFLFGNIGNGHLQPMLALARQLTERGWKAYFYAHANARAKVTDTGALWRSYGTEDWDLFETAQRATTDLLLLEREALQGLSMVRAGSTAAIAMLPYLLQEIENRRPLFTVHDAAAPWGYLAGRIAGLPTVCSMSAFPMTAEQAAHSYPAGPIQKAASEYIRKHYSFKYDPADCYLNYSDFTLVFTAKLWAGNGCDPGHHFCVCPPADLTSTATINESVTVARAEKALGKKIVYVSLGTVVNGTLREYYEGVVYRIFSDVIRALRERKDVHLIISEGCAGVREPGASVLGNIDTCASDNVSVFDYVSQQQLLKYVDCFVTHAGMNSTNEAVWQGVPVVCCPFFGDGPLNAQRFSELGAGVTLNYQIATPAAVASGQPSFSPDLVSVESMRAALFEVLDNERYRIAATHLQDQFRQEMDISRTVDKMLDWVGETRSPTPV